MQLCEFLEEADRFDTKEESRHVLLHNDLKPRNVRVMAEDQIRVLDFGAAKSLSLSRKVTKNDFGSIAYLSPECLESGDRDLHSDAWALGVLLYEMIRGRQPFRANDTRLLEHRIRSRQPPESIDGVCPPALEAIIAKLLAPYAADRYEGPAEIRADLARVQVGDPSDALAEGWPARQHDELPTRRTHPPIADEAVTRRTNAGADRAGALQPGLSAEAQGAKADAPHVRKPRIPRLLRNAIIFIAVALLLNESCVAVRANGLAHTVPLQDFAGLADLWPRYESLAGWSPFGWGVASLEQALTGQARVLSERVMANYRTPTPTVRENQWKAARDTLRRAVAVAPRDVALRAALSYCEGHLYRINGEASKARGQTAQAQQEFTDAVVAFREAASLRPGWPDPFLGLARTFIYGLDDVDRGEDALAQAEKRGHPPSERETTQIADGYRARGETLARTAQTLRGMPQEREYLSRAADAYRQALEKYSANPGFANTALKIRETQQRLDRVEQRRRELEGWWPPWE
jgi:serine/threonine protein kinase